MIARQHICKRVREKECEILNIMKGLREIRGIR